MIQGSSQPSLIRYPQLRNWWFGLTPMLNIVITSPYTKLDYKKLVPFRIIKKINLVIFHFYLYILEFIMSFVSPFLNLNIHLRFLDLSFFSPTNQIVHMGGVWGRQNTQLSLPSWITSIRCSMERGPHLKRNMGSGQEFKNVVDVVHYFHEWYRHKSRQSFRGRPKRERIMSQKRIEPPTFHVITKSQHIMWLWQNTCWFRVLSF